MATRSKSTDHALALRICRGIQAATAHLQARGVRWISLHDLQRHLGIPFDVLDKGIRYGVSAEWLAVDGEPPMCVCLFRGAWEAMKEDAA